MMINDLINFSREKGGRMLGDLGDNTNTKMVTHQETTKLMDGYIPKMSLGMAPDLALHVSRWITDDDKIEQFLALQAMFLEKCIWRCDSGVPGGYNDKLLTSFDSDKNVSRFHNELIKRELAFYIKYWNLENLGKLKEVTYTRDIFFIALILVVDKVVTKGAQDVKEHVLDLFDKYYIDAYPGDVEFGLYPKKSDSRALTDRKAGDWFEKSEESKDSLGSVATKKHLLSQIKADLNVKIEEISESERGYIHQKQLETWTTAYLKEKRLDTRYEKVISSILCIKRRALYFSPRPADSSRLAKSDIDKLRAIAEQVGDTVDLESGDDTLKNKKGVDNKKSGSTDDKKLVVSRVRIMNPNTICTMVFEDVVVKTGFIHNHKAHFLGSFSDFEQPTPLTNMSSEEIGNSGIIAFLEQIIHQGVIMQEHIESVKEVRKMLALSYYTCWKSYGDLTFDTRFQDFTLEEEMDSLYDKNEEFHELYETFDMYGSVFLDDHMSIKDGQRQLYCTYLRNYGAHCDRICMLILCHILKLNCFIFEYDNYEVNVKHIFKTKRQANYLHLNPEYHYREDNKINMVFAYDRRTKIWYNLLKGTKAPYQLHTSTKSELPIFSYGLKHMVNLFWKIGQKVGHVDTDSDTNEAITIDDSNDEESKSDTSSSKTTDTKA
jgi:hypothetical protein